MALGELPPVPIGREKIPRERRRRRKRERRRSMERARVEVDDLREGKSREWRAAFAIEGEGEGNRKNPSAWSKKEKRGNEISVFLFWWLGNAKTRSFFFVGWKLQRRRERVAHSCCYFCYYGGKLYFLNYKLPLIFFCINGEDRKIKNVLHFSYRSVRAEKLKTMVLHFFFFCGLISSSCQNLGQSLFVLCNLNFYK